MTSAIVQSYSAESFKAFYADDSFWVKGVYTDDVLFKVNGEDAPEIDPETLADVDAVEIVSGDVYFSKDELPEGHFLTSLEGRMGLEDAFELWCKVQNTASFVVKYDRSIDADALRAHVAAFDPLVKVIG